MFIYVCAHTFAHTNGFECLQRPEKRIKSSGSGIRNGLELPAKCGCLELNSSPLK